MRQDPNLTPVLNDQFKTTEPSDQTLKDIINLGDNITKLYVVEAIPRIMLHHSFPFVVPVTDATTNLVEIVFTDHLGFIERFFSFDQKPALKTVRVVSQQNGFETRLILLLNEHLEKYHNSHYVIREVTPKLIEIVNEIVRTRLCQ